MDKSAKPPKEGWRLLSARIGSIPFVLGIAVAALAFLPAEVRSFPSTRAANADSAVTLLRSPALQTPTTDGMTIVWATREAAAATVRYGLDWTSPGFDDSDWRTGQTGLGYGGDYPTVLSDMRGKYLTVFARKTFTVTNPSVVSRMTLSVRHVGGFVAYLNGREVARAGVTGYQPDHSTAATRSGSSTETAEFDISEFRSLLVPGENVLAVSGHNATLESTRFFLAPSLMLDIPCTATAIPLGDTWRYAKGTAYPSNLTGKATGNSTFYPPLGGYHQYEVTLAGLRPGTRYHYRVYVDDKEAAGDSLTFRTATTPSGPYVSFLVFGDSGDGSRMQRDLRDVMLGDSFDLAIPVGDLAYPDGTYEELQKYYFDIYKALMQVTSFVPASGNHEYHRQGGKPFFDMSVLPRNGPPGKEERYFSFDYGNVHFVALDTEQVNSTQSDWLRADLKANKQPWTVAYMHRSLFGEGSSHAPAESADLRTTLAPIFEEFRVDLVLAGHNHMYGRSQPLTKGQRDVPYAASTTHAEGGVTYVTTGGGGGKLDEEYRDMLYWPPGTTFSASHYTKVVVKDCSLSLQAIDVTGKVRDRLDLDHCHAVSQGHKQQYGEKAQSEPCPVPVAPTVHDIPPIATPGVVASLPDSSMTAPGSIDCAKSAKATASAFYSSTVFALRRARSLTDRSVRFSVSGLWTRTTGPWATLHGGVGTKPDSACAPPTSGAR